MLFCLEEGFRLFTWNFLCEMFPFQILTLLSLLRVSCMSVGQKDSFHLTHPANHFQVIKSATGKCTETMTRKTWDVGAFVGQRARVKLVDVSSSGWGHINFDDLKGDMSCGLN